MLMPILAAVLGAIMLVGGIIPRVASDMLNSQLRNVLQNARKVETRLVQVPSLGLLSGAVERLELNAEGFRVQGLDVESLQVAISPIKMNGSKMFGGEIELEQNAQAEAKLTITDKNINDFLQSERIKGVLGNIHIKLPEPLPQIDDLAVDDVKIELKKDIVTITGTIKALGGFIDIPLKISAGFELTSENELMLINISAEASGNPVPPEMLQGMTDKLNPILDLRKFSTPDMSFAFRMLQLDDGKLTLVGSANVKKLPNFK